MTVCELQARMGADELREWMAFARLEPFGDLRADLRVGIVASTLANIHRKKGRRAFNAEDFMPYLKRERRRAEGGRGMATRMRAFLKSRSDRDSR